MLNKNQRVFLDTSTYVKEEYNNKFESNIPLSFNDIKDISYSFLETGGIRKYITKIENNDSYLSALDTIDGIIYFSIDGMKKEASKLLSCFLNPKFTKSFPEFMHMNSEELVNQTIISSIIHEVTHALQYYGKSEEEIDKIVSELCKNVSGKKRNLNYLLYSIIYPVMYSKLPFEREAQINQLYSIQLTNVKKDWRQDVMRAYLLEDACRNGYQLGSPFDYYKYLLKDSYDHDKIRENCSSMDTLSIMTYGLPLRKSDKELVNGEKNLLLFKLNDTFYK